MNGKGIAGLATGAKEDTTSRKSGRRKKASLGMFTSPYQRCRRLTKKYGIKNLVLQRSHRSDRKTKPKTFGVQMQTSNSGKWTSLTTLT